MSELRIVQIEKQFQKSEKAVKSSFALQRLNLTIQEGEFFSLLGPSGSGKTTLLKLVAGLLPPDSGEIWFGDADLTSILPEKRRFSMVFQHSLLFPHMNVEDNTAFGLKMQKVGKKKRLSEANQMLELVGLRGFESRFPDELSGGQQQRVALARALVANPRVLLMDEPFSALDPGLREEMRELLSQIHKKLRVTVLFVTHDRQEAFELSDRIGVMSEGKLLQVGTARELHEQPDSTEVASFLGIKNLIPGSIDNGRFVSNENAIAFELIDKNVEESCFLIMRPEALQPVFEDLQLSSDSIYITGRIVKMKLNHGFYIAVIEVGSLQLEAIFTYDQATRVEVNQHIKLYLNRRDLRFVKE